MSRRRVVVTGLGCISPVGNTVGDAWANLLAGQSGIDLITKFDASNFACKIAGEVKGFDVESYMSAKDARSMDTFIHYGIAAAAQRSEEHTSELQSPCNLVCRLLLEKKKKNIKHIDAKKKINEGGHGGVKYQSNLQHLAQREFDHETSHLFLCVMVSHCALSFTVSTE